MIITIDITDSSYFNLNYDVENPLVMINHLLNILPIIPFDKIKWQITQQDVCHLSEVHLFASTFPFPHIRYEWIGIHSDRNFLTWLTYMKPEPLEIFDSLLNLTRIKTKFLISINHLLEKALSYQKSKFLTLSVIQKACNSKTNNPFKKLPRDITEIISSFLFTKSIPYINPSYCSPWKKRAFEYINTINSNRIDEQDNNTKSYGINNCCNIS